MPLLLRWGEEKDLSCVCVVETVFLTLLELLCIRCCAVDPSKWQSEGNFFWLFLV